MALGRCIGQRGRDAGRPNVEPARPREGSCARAARDRTQPSQTDSQCCMLHQRGQCGRDGGSRPLQWLWGYHVRDRRGSGEGLGTRPPRAGTHPHLERLVRSSHARVSAIADASLALARCYSFRPPTHSADDGLLAGSDKRAHRFSHRPSSFSPLPRHASRPIHRLAADLSSHSHNSVRSRSPLCYVKITTDGTFHGACHAAAQTDHRGDHARTQRQ